VQELQAELLSERLDALEAGATITRTPAEAIAPGFLSDRTLLAD